MNAYKIGHCTQCGTQIMVRDPNGKWNSFKSNYKEVELKFKNGPRMRVSICKDCCVNPNYQKLMDSLFHKESQAFKGDRSKRVKHKIKDGLPDSHQVRK